VSPIVKDFWMKRGRYAKTTMLKNLKKSEGQGGNPDPQAPVELDTLIVGGERADVNGSRQREGELAHTVPDDCGDVGPATGPEGDDGR